MTHARSHLVGHPAALLVATLPVSAATLFFEAFADNNAGWTLGPQWQIGPATASPPGGVGSDPALDHTSTANNGIAGTVIGGNVTQSLHDYQFLTSPEINLASAVGSVTLEFYRWLITDYPTFMANKVEVFNGSSWVAIWSQPSNNQVIDDSAWLRQSFDITAHKNSAFQVRIGHGVFSSGALPVGGWNLDDVSIVDQSSTVVPLPGSLPLLVASLGLACVARRKRKQASAAVV